MGLLFLRCSQEIWFQMVLPQISNLRCCALSHDGSRVAAGCGWDDAPHGNGVVVLSTMTGALLHCIGLRNFMFTVNCVAFMSSSRLATGSNDSMLKLWELGGTAVQISRARQEVPLTTGSLHAPRLPTSDF